MARYANRSPHAAINELGRLQALGSIENLQRVAAVAGPPEVAAAANRAIAAINSYQTANGPTAGTWQISSTAVSTVDPSYVLFRIGPAPGHETTVQGGYGFVHDRGGAWTVIGFGSSEVGCPPGNSQNVLVPSAVLAGFGASCPPT